MNHAQSDKIAKHKLDVASSPPGSKFIPLVLDSLGGFHPDLLALLSNASPHAANLPPLRSNNY